MPLWESPEQPTAKSAFDLAEHHIHRAQPDDVIAPLDGWGEYAVWNQSGGAPSTRVATLTVTTTTTTTTGYSPALTRDPRDEILFDPRTVTRDDAARQP